MLDLLLQKPDIYFDKFAKFLAIEYNIHVSKRIISKHLKEER